MPPSADEDDLPATVPFLADELPPRDASAGAGGGGGAAAASSSGAATSYSSKFGTSSSTTGARGAGGADARLDSLDSNGFAFGTSKTAPHLHLACRPAICAFHV